MIRTSHDASFAALALFLAMVTGTPASAAADCVPLEPIPFATLLLPPPANGGEESMAELHELQLLESWRTPAQAEYAKADHDRTLERFLAGMKIALPAKPTVAMHFFDCVAESAEKAVGDAKRHFNRIRPYKYDNSWLHILKKVAADDSPSYPSGHATYGMVVGLLLADMLPEQKADIMQRIENFGMSRLVSGVHFRSDVYAGEIAGAVIVATFFKDEAFRAEYDKARSDLRKAFGCLEAAGVETCPPLR
jgi:acid phosphatase (class A)